MAFYGNENKENIITLTSFLGASEDFFVLVDKQSGTINVYNQEWGVYYSGDRLVGTIKYNQETKSYSPMDYNDENGWRIWLNARGYEKNWFDNPVILNQVIDHAIKLSTKQNIEEGEITQDVYPQIEDILPERTKENTVEIVEVDSIDDDIDSNDNVTSPEKVKDMNKEDLEKERMIIAGDANNDGIADPPSEQRMNAYRQIIQDGPQGKEWDLYIEALKKLYPELENVERITDAELNKMSYEDQWAIRARRSEQALGHANLNREPSLENFSKTSKLKLALADPCKNNFFSTISTNLNTFLTRVTGGVNGVLGTANSVLNFSNELSNTASTILGTAKSFVSQMGDFLQAKIQTFIRLGLKKMATFLFATSFTPIDGLLKVMALNVSAINPVGMVMKVLGCLTSKVADVLHGVIEDMLSNMVGQVVNGVTCAVEQFIGGITNKITSVMDSIVGPFIRPVEMLFKLIGFGFGSIKGLLGKGFDIMNQIGNLLKCGSNKLQKGQCPSSTYIIDQGAAPEKSPNEQLARINKVFDTGSQKLADIKDSANDFKKGVGDWEIFGSKVSEGKNVQRCNTSANIFKCGAPKLEFIGGDGEGAVGKVLLGKVLNKFDPTNLRKDVQSVGSIIGVKMEFPGEGYTKAPIVAFTDSCEQGYGAYGRAVIGQDRTKPTFGQITDIIIISEGVNYPTGDVEDVFVDKIIVEEGGSGYSMDDGIDDFEICGVDENGAITSICPNNKAYRSLPQLNITSVKGSGAILRPIMTTDRRETAPQMEIDCVTT